jgi:hypothetical protein
MTGYRESRATLDRRERKGQLGRKVHRGCKDSRDRRAMMVKTAIWDRRAGFRLYQAEHCTEPMQRDR